MNSFNHYVFEAIGAWMYNSSLEIRSDENSPGFKHFLLQPETDPTGKISFARGYYDSLYGRIESSWKKDADLKRIRSLGNENENVVYLLGSGEYTFRISH